MVTQNTFENYAEQFGSLYEDQLQLEALAKNEAEQAMIKSLESTRLAGEAGQGKLGEKLMLHTWQSCRNNIKVLIADAKAPKKTTQGPWLNAMKDLLSIYAKDEERLEDILVLSGLSKAIDCVFMTQNPQNRTVSNVAYQIGQEICKEAAIERFYQWAEETKDIDVTQLRFSMEKGIEKRVRNSYRVVYAINRMHKEGFAGFKWSKPVELALGAKVLEMIVAGSNYYYIENITIGARSIPALFMTEWFKTAWNQNEGNMIANAVKYPPTIIPPRPWSTPYEGGYYGAAMLGVQLIRMGGYNNKFVSEYVRKLNAVNLDKIYSVLNALQETAFVINKDILHVLKDIYTSGGELGGVPRTEPIPNLPKKPEGTPAEELREHKRKMTVIYKQEEARKSKALRFKIALTTAEKFSQYEKIYFPWNIDYWGRCYPIPTAINPQGDDIQKALLLFAEPTPLAGDDDTKWLAIHGANLAGRDKLTFAERIQWVDDNKDNILASASDPLGCVWWSEIAKNDYPMEFLAFCMEWQKLLAYREQHGTAAGFLSSLPVAFDGTCSGLQHFSGLLRDEIGGAAVNLRPSDQVQDIYSLVADKVNLVLLQDAETGTEDTLKYDKKGDVITDNEGKPRKLYGTKTLAQNWVVFNRLKYAQDGITRKVCKRSVMTLAYGSEKYGFKKNLRADIIDPFVLEHPDDSPFISPEQAAKYMADLIWNAVRETVVKAVEGMAWLQKIARLICKENHVVTWTTPNGLPVQQNYFETYQRTLSLRFNKARVRFYTRTIHIEEADKKEQEKAAKKKKSGVCIDSEKQAQGIAPNFIHSMDAAHLQRVVNSEYEKGNRNFLMIHDSFGTDAAHAGSLFRTIREEFVNLYKDQNHLANFLEQVSYLINETDKVPKLPKFGKLDLEEVKKSDFCFA